MAEKEGFENSIVAEHAEKVLNSVFWLMFPYLKIENIALIVKIKNRTNEK